MYADADLQPDCPGLDPFEPQHDHLRNKTMIQVSSFSIESLLAKQAVEKAEASLEAEAKAQNIQISAEAMVNFKTELEKTIKSTTSASSDVLYVQAYWVGGLRNMGEYSGYKECFRKVRPGEDSIITGIAGLYFSNFKARSSYYSSSQMKTAIDASIKGSWASDPLKLQAVTAKAAAKWQQEMTSTLNVEMEGHEFSNSFRPLYVRFERPQ
ncbi:hypothetical protein WMF37_51395 [Sorangium sp. So ce291]|uniref:hypothetical protein n=1 Tax=Sorangium sp. So ce291 TaxID=3133294 RepID=UPI003F5FAFE6